MSAGVKSPLLAVILALSAMLALWCAPGYAHHVLGRPSYGLNEDSNTPPSMQVETQVGEYLVRYMVFPAFPRPNEPGRVHLYATRVDTGEPLRGEVIFKVRDDVWLGAEEVVLGAQISDGNVFRQGFLFHEAGDYIISAQLGTGAGDHVIDFPLRIGEPSAIGPVGAGMAVLGLLLLAVTIMRRRKLLIEKLRSARTATR